MVPEVVPGESGAWKVKASGKQYFPDGFAILLCGILGDGNTSLATEWKEL